MNSGPNAAAGVVRGGESITTTLAQLTQRIQASNLVTDADSASYWAYHTARMTFFISQGIASLAAHHASTTLSNLSLSSLGASLASLATSSSSSTAAGGGAGAGGSQTPLLRLMSGGSAELTNRLVEAINQFSQDYDFIKEGKFKTPWVSGGASSFNC